MSRRQRQLDELRSLCGSGAVARAIDLAFSHFADFGHDEVVIALLSDAIVRSEEGEDVCRRLTELTSHG
jgi:hypothetical protein